MEPFNRSPHPPAPGPFWGRVLGAASLLAAGAWFLFADYPPAALAALMGFIFLAYLGMRVLIFWDNNRFTPRRLQVGITWALIGIDADTEEFDTRPVRVYFAILALLAVGVLARPVFLWMLA